MNIIATREKIAQKIQGFDVEKIYEAVALSYIFLYFVSLADIVNLTSILKSIRIAVAIVAILHVCFLIIRKNAYRYLFLDIIFLLMYAKIIYYCSLNVPLNADDFAETLVLGICILGLDFRKVLKTVSVAFVIQIFYKFLCTFTNIIDPAAREYSRTFGDTTTTVIRSAWGYNHENIFGLCCFVAVLSFCLGFNQYSKVLKSVVAFLVAYFVWVIPNSRFNTYLLILLGLALFVDWLHDIFFHKKKIFNIFRRGFEILVLFLAAVIPMLLVGIVLNYEKIDPVLLQKLDSLSSSRIYLCYNGYRELGFSLWGQYYDSGYYPDMGWIRLPIMLGIPMTVFVLGALLYLGVKAYRKDDFLLICTILLMSISGICYELVSLAQYNIFLFMPFAKYIGEKEEIQTSDKVLIGKVKAALSRNVGLIVTSITVACLMIFRKNIVSLIQTLNQCKNPNYILRSILFLVLLALFALLIIGLSGCLKALISHSKNTKAMRTLLISCVCLFTMFAYGWYSVKTIGLHEEAYEEVLADKDAMEIIENIDDVTVVPQSEPYLYKKYYGFTDLKWLPTADYARFENMTVIVDARDNYRTLYNTGFVQTPISDYHKIYTNDSRVIEAMESAGYTFTYYSQYVKEMDLKQYAKLNKLKWSKKNGLMIKASENGQAITEKLDEDFVDLTYDELKAIDVDGGYILHAVLNADAGDLANMNPEDTVAHILITSGDQTYLDYRITCGEFVDGTATCDIPFGLWKVNSARTNTTFTIDEVYNLDFSIQEMSYYRVN